ncbi:MAG: hypothetical protein M1120_03595 [Patescibacteria group bacterium]|nr:hypothetical protein [Patescibacteria group bacterium]
MANIESKQPDIFASGERLMLNNAVVVFTDLDGSLAGRTVEDAGRFPDFQIHQTDATRFLVRPGILPVPISNRPSPYVIDFAQRLAAPVFFAEAGAVSGWAANNFRLNIDSRFEQIRSDFLPRVDDAVNMILQKLGYDGLIKRFPTLCYACYYPDAEALKQRQLPFDFVNIAALHESVNKFLSSVTIAGKPLVSSNGQTELAHLTSSYDVALNYLPANPAVSKSIGLERFLLEAILYGLITEHSRFIFADDSSVDWLKRAHELLGKRAYFVIPDNASVKMREFIKDLYNWYHNSKIDVNMPRVIVSDSPYSKGVIEGVNTALKLMAFRQLSSGLFAVADNEQHDRLEALQVLEALGKKVKNWS